MGERRRSEPCDVPSPSGEGCCRGENQNQIILDLKSAINRSIINALKKCNKSILHIISTIKVQLNYYVPVEYNKLMKTICLIAGLHAPVVPAELFQRCRALREHTEPRRMVA